MVEERLRLSPALSPFFNIYSRPPPLRKLKRGLRPLFKNLPLFKE